MHENEIGTIIVEECIDAYRELGPGMYEAVYEVVLVDALRRRGLEAERQAPIPIVFRGVRFDEGFRADVIVEHKVLLEIKSIEKVAAVHKKQVNTYLRFQDAGSGTFSTLVRR
jgi:GxxExxY protein